MKHFEKWYNDFKVTEIDFESILIKTAISRLYFESIHPFEDGNGRIGRAVSVKCLFESLGNHLPISISTVIESEKKKYDQKPQKFTEHFGNYVLDYLFFKGDFEVI